MEKTHADGTRIPCILRSTPFIGPDGDTIGIVESFQDITDLKHSQLELRAERDKLHRILFQQLECVSIFNADWEIEYQNEISKAIFSNAIGRKCYEVYHQRETPCPDCQMTRAIASGIIQRQEVDSAGLKSFEHTYTPFVDTDSCRKVVVSSRDITENRASRQAALSSERLAALGELAAGVAHEINNPINGIINYAQMVRNKYGDDGKISDISSRIVKEGNRIANIVESLLSFARREKDERMVTDLEAVLTDALTLTAAQLRKDAIAIDVDILGDLPPMVVNPQKIQQVFVNLISNARYALQQKADSPGNGLKLYISARALQTEGQPQIRVVFDLSLIHI